jgi:hypothetical protein
LATRVTRYNGYPEEYDHIRLDTPDDLKSAMEAFSLVAAEFGF